MDRCDECGWQAEGGSCSLSDNDFVYCKLHGRISFKEKENSNVAKPNRYNVLGDAATTETTATIPKQCNHDTGWFHYVRFLCFKRKYLACEKCGELIPKTRWYFSMI